MADCSSVTGDVKITPLRPDKAGWKPAAVTVETLPLLVPTTQTGLPQIESGIDEALQFRRMRRAQAVCIGESRRVRWCGIRHHDVEVMTQEKVGGPDQEIAGRIDDIAGRVEAEQAVAASHQDDARARLVRRVVETHGRRLDDERRIDRHRLGIGSTRSGCRAADSDQAHTEGQNTSRE